MASYYVGHEAAAGTDLCIMSLTSTASVVGSLHQLIIGSDATPADVATEFNVKRHTTAAVGGTALTEEQADPQSASPSCTTLGGTYTTDPVDSAAELLNIALNQRATYTWIANPGRELRTTVGTANGLMLLSVASGGTPNINATMAWDE